jgi:hypothetical protein
LGSILVGFRSGLPIRFHLRRSNWRVESKNADMSSDFERGYSTTLESPLYHSSLLYQNLKKAGSKVVAAYQVAVMAVIPGGGATSNSKVK